MGVFAQNTTNVVLDDFGAGTITSAPTGGSAGTDTSASTPITIVLSNVQTPILAQTTDTYSIQSLTSSDTIIDNTTDISGDTFDSPPTSGVNVKLGGVLRLSGCTRVK